MVSSRCGMLVQQREVPCLVHPLGIPDPTFRTQQDRKAAAADMGPRTRPDGSLIEEAASAAASVRDQSLRLASAVGVFTP
jgi:hypothetical protein